MGLLGIIMSKHVYRFIFLLPEVSKVPEGKYLCGVEFVPQPNVAQR